MYNYQVMVVSWSLSGRGRVVFGSWSGRGRVGVRSGRDRFLAGGPDLRSTTLLNEMKTMNFLEARGFSIQGFSIQGFSIQGFSIDGCRSGC